LDLAPQNILVMDLGQLGDVVLSLPALEAIRDRFPDSRKSILVGAACADVVRLTGIFDEVIVVNRGELRRMNKLKATARLIKFARDIRRQRFDFIIDIHSLPETNILAYVSGAPLRLLGNRESRSIDRLSNFRPRPPMEDKSVHISRYYLNVLRPLGVTVDEPRISLRPRPEEVELARSMIGDAVLQKKRLVGICPGAGHVSRRWPLENFGEVADKLIHGDDTGVVVFLGPEEASKPEFAAAFGDRVSVVSGLTIPQLVAGFSLLSIVVGNDSGPVHIAAAAGVPVVLLQNRFSPPRFLPLAERMKVVQRGSVAEITVDEAVTAVDELAPLPPRPPKA
jgi:ADP-heptose:LPS heptosyltransferase